MQAWKRIALGAAILAAVLACGCKSNSTQQNGQNGPGGQAPAAMEGTQGVVTAVSADSVTIAVMPAGSMPQGGMGQPSGSGAPDASGRPEGTPPAGGAADPQGTGGRQPSATMDTSGWEKKTYAIDSSTKIVEIQFGSSGTRSTALTASDLKVGDTVSVEESAGGSGKAGTITVMQGMGGPAPAATSKS